MTERKGVTEACKWFKRLQMGWKAKSSGCWRLEERSLDSLGSVRMTIPRRIISSKLEGGKKPAVFRVRDAAPEDRLQVGLCSTRQSAFQKKKEFPVVDLLAGKLGNRQ